MDLENCVLLIVMTKLPIIEFLGIICPDQFIDNDRLLISILYFAYELDIDLGQKLNYGFINTVRLLRENKEWLKTLP